MTKTMTTPKIVGVGFIIFGIAIVALLVTGFISISDFGVNTFGNVSNLSFVTDHSLLNCESFNKLAVTENGVKRVVASGRDGFNPLINLMDITNQGVEFESFHVQLWLLCDGKFMKDSSAVTVSGTNNLLLCGDPSRSGTICLLSDDRRFQTINGQAVSTTQFNSFPLGSFALPDETETLIYEGNMRSDDLERIFPEGVGTITFTSRMFPQLTLTFNHPTLGIFTATYDSLAKNDLVYSQWSGIANNVALIPDTDGDGFIDTEDGCINQPETVNGFQDEDGCPDEVPICPQGVQANADGTCPDDIFDGLTDTDGDGVNDAEDACPDTKPNAEVDSLGCQIDIEFDGSGMTAVCDSFVVIATGSCIHPSNIIDFDEDGVPENFNLDKCPDTTLGIAVNEDGCSEMQLFEIDPTDCSLAINRGQAPCLIVDVFEDVVTGSLDDDQIEVVSSTIPPPLFQPDETVQQPPVSEFVTTEIRSQSDIDGDNRTLVILGLAGAGVLALVVIGIIRRK